MYLIHLSCSQRNIHQYHNITTITVSVIMMHRLPIICWGLAARFITLPLTRSARWSVIWDGEVGHWPLVRRWWWSWWWWWCSNDINIKHVYIGQMTSILKPMAGMYGNTVSSVGEKLVVCYNVTCWQVLVITTTFKWGCHYLLMRFWGWESVSNSQFMA